MQKSVVPILILIVAVIVFNISLLTEGPFYRSLLLPSTPTQTYQAMLHATETAFASRLPESRFLSPDEQHLIGMEGTMIGLWDAETGEFLQLLKEAYSPPGNTFVEFSPDGRYAWHSGLYFYLWDLAEREKLMMRPFTIASLRSLYFVSENARYFAFWQCDSSGSSHGICGSMSFSIFDTELRQDILRIEGSFALFVSGAEFNEEKQFVRVIGCRHFQILRRMVYGNCEEPNEMVWDLSGVPTLQ